METVCHAAILLSSVPLGDKMQRSLCDTKTSASDIFF